jgi:hypothetical protein
MKDIHDTYFSLSILPSSSNDLNAAMTTSSSSDPENYRENMVFIIMLSLCTKLVKSSYVQ